ncbi:Small ribosomal subunit biogenesis GTPase [[Mycoplasma] cavipharyngis]|uniref:GTPase RsgA n=1 Tax=[Mycoplasma] cavipharyngis TaxID=92757 RepID=UPI0037044E45
MKFSNAKINDNIKKCKGCGSYLNNNQDSLGYTPKKITEINLCQSCYRLKHYQKPSAIDPLADQDFLKKWTNFKLALRKSKKFLTVIVSDIYNLAVLDNLEKFLISSKILICLNKIELLDFWQKKALEFAWITTLKKFNCQFEIIFLSAKNKVGINQLLAIANKYFQICFVGMSGVGKSLIVNQVMKKLGHNSLNSVGSFLNTTKGFLVNKIKQQKLIDSPGFKRDQGIFNWLDHQTIKLLQESSWNKRIFQIDRSRVYFWENYLVVELMIETNDDNVDQKMSLVFYGPNCLKISHIKSNKFQLEQLNNFPNHKKYCPNNDQAVKWIKHQFKISEKTHFVIDDLGWIDFNPKQLITINFYLPETVKINQFINRKPLN